MSCHLSHRLTTVHRAVSMALLCSVTLISNTQAATFGKTVVTSTQHEPLAANIVVTNIRAADFSASLANSTMYQRMGLTPTDSMMVSFTPTSATSGQVFITTSKPVSKPFADVVLSINDAGQNKVIPKTLLMPLNNNLPIDPSKNIWTGKKESNVVSVSASTTKPLTVRKGAPPPLMSTPNLLIPQLPVSELVISKLPVPSLQINSLQINSIRAKSIQAPAIASTLQNNDLTYGTSRLANGRLNSRIDMKNINNHSIANDDNLSSVRRLDNDFVNADKKVMTIGASNIDINAVKNAANGVTSNQTVTNDRAAIDSNTMITDSAMARTVNTIKSLDILSIQVTRQIRPSSQSDMGIIANSPIMLITPNNYQTNTTKTNFDASNTSVPANNIAPKTVSTNATTQYQVQRNDSLWVIAQQIAKDNHLDTQIVMKQIQSQNPNAFINKDTGQLKADATLSLPGYDVIPSQKKIETATSAQEQDSRRANTLSKAQFSMLAPDYNGSAEGTQTKPAATIGNGLSTDILAMLKSSRKNAAAQSQSLSKTSIALDSYTKKIQLQNQKLAELQARLKKLRNQ